jgi:hypothetical protein
MTKTIQQLMAASGRVIHAMHDEPFLINGVPFMGTPSAQVQTASGDDYGPRGIWEMTITAEKTQFDSPDFPLQVAVGGVRVGSMSAPAAIRVLIQAKGRAWTISQIRDEGNDYVFMLMEQRGGHR